MAQAIFIGLFECNGYDLNVSFVVLWASFSALKKFHNFICAFKGQRKINVLSQYRDMSYYNLITRIWLFCGGDIYAVVNFGF